MRKLYSVLVTADREDNRVLGDAPHIRQMRVSGVFPARIAFAQALVDAHMMGQSVNSTSRYIRDYGGDGDPDYKQRGFHFQPGQLYVSSAQSGIREVYVKFPYAKSAASILGASVGFEVPGAH